MDFSFSDEQRLLEDACTRFLAQRYDFESRQRIRAGASGHSREIWRELADLGLLALAAPEADGGLAAGPVAAHLVSRAMGAGLLLEPYLGSAIVATTALAQLPASPRRDALLAAMIAGDCIAVPTDETWPVADRVRAERDGDGWRLEGGKAAVYHAPVADVFLLPVPLDGRLALFALPVDAAGLSVTAARSIDDQAIGHLKLAAVRLPADALLATDAEAAFELALQQGLAALCADALGAMERMLADTIGYSKSRQQFGVPIGRFQALQHRMADLYMQVEQARSMSYLAATCLDADTGDARRAALSAAKARIGQAARQVGQEAVQMHGGMGMTDELALSHHFRRLTAFERRYGSTQEHLQRYRALTRTAA